jgi:hypothetical protein
LNTNFYIKTDNSLWGYGANDKGILGDGTGVNQEKPVKILDNVAWIGCLYHSSYMSTIHMYAITTDKTLWKWGNNENYSPVEVGNAVKYYIDTNAFSSYYNPFGYIHRMVLTSEGKAVNYELDPSELYATKVYPLEPTYDVKYGKKAESGNIYYIDTNKNLYIIQSTEFVTPTYETSLIAENVEKFTGSPSVVHFIKTDGTLWGYGANGNGQLGDGTKIPERPEPVKIADNVILADDYAFLNSNGEVWAWTVDNPTPQKLFDNIKFIGKSEFDPYAYMVDNNGKILYISIFNYWNWADFSDPAKVTELTDVKLPQIVTFP